MNFVKGLMGLSALIIVAILLVAAMLLGNGLVHKLLWWVAAGVMVIAAINTSSYT